jgi:hypothetical protein
LTILAVDCSLMTFAALGFIHAFKRVTGSHRGAMTLSTVRTNLVKRSPAGELSPLFKTFPEEYLRNCDETKSRPYPLNNLRWVKAGADDALTCSDGNEKDRITAQ